MSSTTTNFAFEPPLKAATARIMNMLATIPDIVFTRTGVPSFALNFPKNFGKAPSYAATARMRSEPIIHTAPEVSSAPMKHSAVMSRSVCAAPP